MSNAAYIVAEGPREHLVLEWDDIPPSLNSNESRRRGAHWSQSQKHKQIWEGVFAAMVLKAKLPRPVRAIVAYPELRFPTRHRRDGPNYYSSIEKPLGDVLVKMGYIPDDTPEYWHCQAVEIGPVQKPGGMFIVLEFVR